MQIRIADEFDQMFEYDYKQVINLNIEDDYAYRDPKLVQIMVDKFLVIFKDDFKVNTL